MSATPSPLALPASQQIQLWWLPYQREQGRAPLLALLGRYLQQPPGQIQLAIGPHGRPSLAGALSGVLDFNWSHSGQQAVVAIACGLRIGVDMEWHRPRPRMLDLARRYFAASEWQQLQQLPPAAQEAAFWALWTGKEAVLKAAGTGLVHGLERVCFDATAADWPLQRVEGLPGADWQLQRPHLHPQCSAALAWQGAAAEVRLMAEAD